MAGSLISCSHVMVVLQALDHMCSMSSYLLSSFLLSVGFDSLPVPLFHEPVTEFLLVPVDCVSGGDEGVGMNGRVM